MLQFGACEFSAGYLEILDHFISMPKNVANSKLMLQDRNISLMCLIYIGLFLRAATSGAFLHHRRAVEKFQSLYNSLLTKKDKKRKHIELQEVVVLQLNVDN